MTFYLRKNKSIYLIALILIAIAYASIQWIIMAGPLHSILFDYTFLLNLPLWVSFGYLAIHIYWNYVMEYLIVKFGNSKAKFFRVRNRKNSEIIELLKSRASTVSYVQLGKGFKIN